MARDLCWIDLETTGLEWSEGHEIIEVAIIMTDARLIEQERWHALVMPLRPGMVSPETQAINGFDLQRWRDEGARSIADVLPEILVRMTERSPAGQNIGFDLGHLTAAMGKSGTWPRRTVDLQLLAWPLHASGRLDRRGLADICACLGVVNADPHRAMGDIEATVECARRLLSHHISPEVRPGEMQMLIEVACISCYQVERVRKSTPLGGPFALLEQKGHRRTPEGWKCPSCVARYQRR